MEAETHGHVGNNNQHLNSEYISTEAGKAISTEAGLLESRAMPIKTVGICTGGGDCPGLNAVIRAAVKASILKYEWRVMGIADGFDGLIWPEKSRELKLSDVSGILPRGGTNLGTTNRGNPFRYRLEDNGQTLERDLSGRLLRDAHQLWGATLIAR